MPLIPVTLPPGVYRNGTLYQSKGRWAHVNRVRWQDGAMRAIGGWSRKNGSDLAGQGEYIRDGHAWRTNSRSQITVWGSNTALKWQKADGSIEVISNGSGLTPDDGQPSYARGYGTGLYGAGLYGVSPPVEDAGATDVGRWSFDTWGENLLAMPDWEGKIYQWVPQTGTDMQLIAEAPTGIADFIVTSERFVMTVGDAGALRLVQWSDRENLADWTPTPTNQAGSYTLPGDGKIIGIYRLRDQAFILTETDAWSVRYIGPPYVYSFDRVGEMCAPAHRKFAAKLPSGALVWLGQRSFWIYDGGVKELPCDVIDFLIADVQDSSVSQSFAWVNAKYNEIWFHYPSVRSEPIEGTDPPIVDTEYYVSWDWITGAWSQGELQRSAAIGPGVYPDPQMVGRAGWSYWHEREEIQFSDGIKAEAVTGPIELGNGDKNVVVRAIYPDSQYGNWGHNDDHTARITTGPVKLRLESRQMPTDRGVLSPEYSYPTVDNQPIATRVMGRDVMLHLYVPNTEQSGWEWGNFRLDVTYGGNR